MSTEVTDVSADFRQYTTTPSLEPLFLLGDSLDVLQSLPSESIDCCMTSPPYWGQRKYAAVGIGLEDRYADYVKNLAAVLGQVKRVLKAEGSLWLNLGDSYSKKQLVGIPWRVAIELSDHQGWILRNDVIWNKIKGGMDNSKDKLSNVHEHVFHFTKQRSYYYDVDAIRSNPKKSKVLNGAVVSATGVSGVRYRRQIELSTALSESEKILALKSLNEILNEISEGQLADFRMIIRGQQRATHSDSEQVSGRARELRERGFYFLKYHPKGSKPGDVWDILPEDTQKREGHFAPYPADLCKTPIIATCPIDGIVLDPFCGTGTTALVAFELGRKSIGIDTSEDYIIQARRRCHFLL